MSPTRTIGLNGLFLDYPHSGTWTYTTNLVAHIGALDRNSSYRLAIRRAELDASLPGNVTANRPAWPRLRGSWPSAVLERADKAAWEQIAWPASARRCDILHSLYFSAPACRPCPLVVTMHDCISLRPEYQHSGAAGIYARVMALVTRHADAIITVSNHAKSDIANILGYPQDRIFVTPEAPSGAMRPTTAESKVVALRHRYGLPDRYILYLGGTEKRKNIETLINAWAGIQTDDVKLVIVGRFKDGDDFFPNIPRMASALGIGERIQFLGSVLQEDLPALFSNAILFCFPSVYEGFGLPPVEAMACGAPVLASNATSLTETLGSGAELLDPNDVAAWREALARCLSDKEYRRQLADRGREWVARYSWNETARLTLEVYDWVLARR